uniref:Uncharacterized protein n=1 Tax=Chenopodium quinoa TaxID=63459 RepID=A0A803KMU4_CHEQI
MGVSFQPEPDPELVDYTLSEAAIMMVWGFLVRAINQKAAPSDGQRWLRLGDVFVSNVEKNCMMEMIDYEVLQQASRDEIQQVAELALTCVAKKGVERPTMIDVVGELWSIQGRDMKWNRNCVGSTVQAQK